MTHSALMHLHSDSYKTSHQRHVFSTSIHHTKNLGSVSHSPSSSLHTCTHIYNAHVSHIYCIYVIYICRHGHIHIASF